MRCLCVVLLALLPAFCFAAPATYTLELDEVRLVDLARVVYGDIEGSSYVFDSDLLQAVDLVSIKWQDAKSAQVLSLTHDLLGIRGYEAVTSGGVVLIRKRDKTDEDLLVYAPVNRSARYLSDVLMKVTGAQQLGARTLQATQAQQQSVQAQPESAGAASTLIDRNAADQIAYNCLPAQCARLRKLLVDLDTPEAQVILKAALYEVGTTKGEGSAFQIAAKLLQGKIGVSVGSMIAGSNQLTIGGSDLSMIYSALDGDSRFHVVSRPMLRVKTGGVAKFSVGSQVPVLGSISYDAMGHAIQAVDYKQSGTIFTVTPDIRRDLIDLNISQEMSSFVVTTTGVNNSPTLLQRSASSQLSIKPGEVVVFAGLEEQRDDESSNSLFGWVTGKAKNKTTSEVLLFIEAQRI